MASATSSDIDVALEELETRLERLRALYEQYFIGIEKLEPSVPRQDIDRRIYALRKVQIRNTAKRFKLQTIIQRYNAFQQYWLRICREIENGTYHRHVARAQSRFGDVPLTAAARRRARLQVQNQTDEQKAASEEKARAQKDADDDLEALLGEDLDVALSRALLAADDVEMIRVDPATPSGPAQAVPVTAEEAAPPKVSVAPPRPRMVSTVEASAPAKSLTSKPPPRTKPAVAATPEVAAAPRSPSEAAPVRAPTMSLKPPAGESPATVDRAGVAAAPPTRKAPTAADARAAKPQAKDAVPAARPGSGGPAPAGGAPEVAKPPAAGAMPPLAAGATRRAGAPVVAAPVAAAPVATTPAAAVPVAAAPVAAASPAAVEKGAGKSAAAGAAPGAAAPVEGKKRVRAKQAASSKGKPAAPVAKDGGWAALRMPAEQRQGRGLPRTVAEGMSAGNSAQPAQVTAGPRPAAKSPPKAEPARAEASPKAPAPAAPPAQPSPAPAAAATGAAESKTKEPKPVPAEVAPRAPAPQVATAAPAARALAEADAPAAPVDARAAAAAGRTAAARAAEIRSQAHAAPQGAGLDDQRLSQLHGALVAERRRLNQPGKVSKDALAASLRDTESKLRQQYGDKQIDFHVVVKDGKAVVKPIVG